MGTLENQVTELNELLDSMEGDTIDLDAAVTQYGKAVQLAGKISKKLSDTDAKLTTLKQKSDALFPDEHI